MLISWYFYTYEHLKFHAQLSWAWKKFYYLGAWSAWYLMSYGLLKFWLIKLVNKISLRAIKLGTQNFISLLEMIRRRIGWLLNKICWMFWSYEPSKNLFLGLETCSVDWRCWVDETYSVIFLEFWTFEKFQHIKLVREIAWKIFYLETWNLADWRW